MLIVRSSRTMSAYISPARVRGRPRVEQPRTTPLDRESLIVLRHVMHCTTTCHAVCYAVLRPTVAVCHGRTSVTRRLSEVTTIIIIIIIIIIYSSNMSCRVLRRPTSPRGLSPCALAALALRPKGK